ncbi:MAG: radical SAM protein [Candidatus Bathyarchaeota archaeon]|nr:radical SAM protein [Candidatus Bathyarchaeota archaeon]MDH5746691.1 radical SAM protein [Candidatus Bathyarchaeota archaeon]
MPGEGIVPEKIRVSLGSAIVLGLLKGKLNAMPTTAYLLTYRRGRCTANCGFCPQARGSHGRADMLSRVSWPVFQTRHVLNGVENAVKDGRIKRVCLQALNYPEVFQHLLALVNAIHSRLRVPISISCQPLNRENMQRLADAGAERIGIPLDAATEELFEKVKGRSVGGPYVWEEQFKLLSEATGIFGKGKVSTHLIAGLGETEREMVEIIQRCADMGVLPALFAFTPIPGTILENDSQPSVPQYRSVQLARHLIFRGIARYENIRFSEEGCVSDFGVDEERLMQIIQTGEPFHTSGCPNCNRPYYNEKPSGPIYNYPRPLTKKETLQILQELKIR